MLLLHLATQAALQDVLLVAAVVEALLATFLHVAQRGEAGVSEARQRPGGAGRYLLRLAQTFRTPEGQTELPVLPRQAPLHPAFDDDQGPGRDRKKNQNPQRDENNIRRRKMRHEQSCLIIFEFKGNRHLDPGNHRLATPFGGYEAPLLHGFQRGIIEQFMAAGFF